MDRLAFFATPQPIEKAQRDVIEWEFAQMLLSPHDSLQVWRALFAFFVPHSEERVRAYYDSYWKWFVLLTWKYLANVSTNQFADVFLSQLPTACLLKDDVEADIFYYVYRIPDGPNEQQTVFNQIREKMMSSVVSLNPLAGSSPTLSSLQKKLTTVPLAEDELIEKSALYADVKATYETAGQLETLQILDHSFDSTTNLLNFIIFFSEQRDIVQIVYDYFDDAYRLAYMHGNEEVLQEPEESVNPVPNVSPPQPSVRKPASPSTPSYSAIQKQLQSEFQFGPDGQPKDIEGIIARLDALAKEYNDEKINELLYFNEQTGRFEWNM